MRKFIFKYEALAQVRKIKEQESLKIFADSQKILRTLLEDSIYLKNRVQNNTDQQNNNKMMESDLWLENKFYIGNRIRLAQLNQRILRAQKNSEKARSFYQKSVSNRKITDVLKENEWNLHLYDSNHESEAISLENLMDRHQRKKNV